MGKKRMANKKSSAMLTLGQKAKLSDNSDTQPLTILTPTFDSHSDHQPPKSNKAKTNTSGASTSMASKNKESTRQRGKAKLDSVSDPQPPKSKKAKTNTFDGPSKKEANMESSTIVTESSTRQRGKAKVDTNSDSKKAKKITTSDDGSNRRGKEILKSARAVAEKSKFKKPKTPPPKKMADVVESSSSGVVTRSGKKGKAKLESKLPCANTTSEAAKKTANVEKYSSTKGKAKLESSARKIQSFNSAKKMDYAQTEGKAMEEDSNLGSKQPKSTISEERPNVQTSGVLTRRGKAKMGSDPTPPADPEPPKSKKAKGTTSTASSTRRGKVKMDSDPTPAADPEPPKPKKAKSTSSTSRGNSKRPKKN